MKNTLLIMFSLVILFALTESKPRRHNSRHRYENEWSEDSEEQTDYDNGSSNRMGPRPPVNRMGPRPPVNRMGPRPAVNSRTYNDVDRNDMDDDVTVNLPYPRPFTPDQSGGNRNGGYGTNLQEAYGRNGRMPYNFETNFNRQRAYEIGDFGNGHHSTNTFNIHKKIIYIE